MFTEYAWGGTLCGTILTNFGATGNTAAVGKKDCPKIGQYGKLPWTKVSVATKMIAII